MKSQQNRIELVTRPGESDEEQPISQPVSGEAPEEGSKAPEAGGVTSAEGTVESGDKVASDLEGLTGADLYRCANRDCGFSTEMASDFKDHLQVSGH